MKLNPAGLRLRARAGLVHLLLSAGVAALAAALVFLLWYPGPFRLMSGGRDLFLLVVGVDIVLGPLLTFVVFDLSKGWPHLRRDLAVIGAIQLAGLGYGLHTVFIVRPVAAVFEVDRFRVVTANNVHEVELPQALPAYRELPLTGPWLLSARPAQAGEERNEALFMALDGVDTGQRPIFWRPYEEGRAQALARSRPVAVLIERYPARAEALREAFRSLAVDSAALRFLPVIARGDWVVFLDAAGNPVGYFPADGFF